MTSNEINSKLQIVSLKGRRFRCPEGYQEYTRGFALFVPELGYMAWEDEPLAPYSPPKKALQSILDAGGLINYSLTVWLRPI